MSVIFQNQKLSVTLTAKDADGDIVNLDGKTVHFYYRDPSGNESINTTPTIADATNGQVLHIFAADALDETGIWQTKLYITTDQIPSTRYDFRVYASWER
jgi:hypothetical protein